jgi:hypothetical protein
MKRVGGLAKAIVIVLAVFVVGQLLSLATIGTVKDAAEEYLQTRDEDAFEDDLVVNGWTSLLVYAATIAVIVLSIIWLYRLATNHRGLGRQLTWAPAWAIAGWFLPPLLFIIPLLMIRESWKASTRDVPPGSPDWKRQGDSPLVWIWFLLGIALLVTVILGAAELGNVARDTEDIAEQFDDQVPLIVAQAVVTILAAIAWALVVREITSRHTQLTGEAATR